MFFWIVVWVVNLLYVSVRLCLGCGGMLTAKEGEFASPNWPKKYTNGEHCTWSIKVAKDKVCGKNLSIYESVKLDLES